MKIDPERALRVEELLGRRVRALDGAVVGRIEEVRADNHGERYEVTEYHLGTGAMLERLGIVSRLLGRQPQIYIVKWDQMDLSKPHEPRLTCDIRDIQRKRT
jgi:sporulation protein YlmC with PRC-barrel domain